MRTKYEETPAADINTISGLKSKLCSRGYRNSKFYPEKCASCQGCCFGIRLIELLEADGAAFEKRVPEKSLTAELMQIQQPTSLSYRIRRHKLGRE